MVEHYRHRASDDKAERRAARELFAAYHREPLRWPLERVRDRFSLLDSGDIDEFDPDDLIHRYKRAAADLYGSVASSGSTDTTQAC